MEAEKLIAPTLTLRCCTHAIISLTQRPEDKPFEHATICHECKRTIRFRIEVEEAQQVLPFPVETSTSVNVRRPDLVVHASDTIRLEPLTEYGASKLRQWGCWWFVVSGAGKRGESWVLRSVKNQPREQSKTKVEVMNVLKQTPVVGDKDFVIVQVVVHPEEFNFKKHSP